MDQRRSGDFVERISKILIYGAFLGGFVVLLDLRAEFTIYGQAFMIGKDGFAPEVKGMVLQSMLISGFAAVVAYWLGTTKQGQEQALSVTKIAEAAAPATARAVAAARAPAPAEAVAPDTPVPPAAPPGEAPQQVEIVSGPGSSHENPLPVDQKK